MVIVMRCARGCVLPGRHEPGCLGCTCDCHTTLVNGVSVPCAARGKGCTLRHDECTGCEGAPAVFGFLCSRCSRSLRDLLGDRETPDGPHGFAWIYDHLSEHLDPVVRGFGSGRGGGDESPVPIRLEVLDLQFQIAETLNGWMGAAIDAAPHARLAGPKVLSAGSISRWLLAQIDLIEASDFVGDLLGELDELAGEAHRCAPWRAGAKVLSGVPCPWCHATALRIPGGECDVRCGYCGAWIDHKRYTMWARYLADSVRTHARKRVT